MLNQRAAWRTNAAASAARSYSPATARGACSGRLRAAREGDRASLTRP
jgi:hypothetical protein